jgi:hypothetical protein
MVCKQLVSVGDRAHPGPTQLRPSKILSTKASWKFSADLQCNNWPYLLYTVYYRSFLDREDSKKNGVYVCPDSGAKPEISTTQEPSIYMSLSDNREPGNPYQSLQFPNIHTVS